MRTRFVILSAGLVVLAATTTSAQFRRGLLAESTEITLSPINPPAILLPPGAVEVQVRNTSTASARLVDRIRDLFGQQLTDNDSRLSVAAQGDVIIVATLTEWNESRRNGTKYVSEQRQIGTRQVARQEGQHQA